ncbi:ABC transporter substrate-binding protein [Herbaspirillum sp. RTI4]|uniref:ABC transporter substrate-binding protein n=1 Tax=Herbaspirillum sp. RTI4 TaxID=3048640 RepID=UPI002AB362AD|nr:ABC transporter substrate-binding protein [Herbaspirillum sp. RTI4]MDY7578127.1 ABC transporter substrate-binding protein [Herbaspirillum sp. RTI4]MEA9980716.1 ABC transporter substrate-binding protein [Herbaspirillum sp. RTI4]
MKSIRRLALLLAITGSSAAYADITVGVTLSTTGPAASLGIPEKNTIALLPTSIAGQKINYIVLDDASDTTQAVKNTRRFITENKADLVIGSTISPNSLSMTEVVAEAQTPMISLAASARIVEPMDAKKKWVFKTPQNDSMMSLMIVQSMVDMGVKRVGFIGFANAYGEGWYTEFSKAAAIKKLEIVANERFSPSDTSATAQVLKVMSAKPDAILIAGSGTPAVVPQRALKERGYQGKIYQTHGVANADFLRLGGKMLDGTLLPSGPVLVAAQLPADHPVRKVALEYVQKYEAAYGKDSVSLFGGYAWDAGLLLQAALPQALKKAQPGTPEFRAALREALENVKNLNGVHGVYNMSATDHLGLDQRARVMVKIEKGAWKYQP